MATTSEPAAIFPTPVFEGSEKRIEVDFCLGPNTSSAGLRALPRSALDALMEQAACCIVSARHNTHFDAYVLSESSFFVYPDKAVLKTCGTTKLLAAVAPLLELAAGLGMTPRRVKFSRASFLFPEQQVSSSSFHGHALCIKPGHLALLSQMEIAVFLFHLQCSCHPFVQLCVRKASRCKVPKQ